MCGNVVAGNDVKGPKKVSGVTSHGTTTSSGDALAGQAAFLGPQIWDKTLSFDLLGEMKDFQNFELEYMDIDEFFNVSTWTSMSSSM